MFEIRCESLREAVAEPQSTIAEAIAAAEVAGDQLRALAEPTDHPRWVQITVVDSETGDEVAWVAVGIPPRPPPDAKPTTAACTTRRCSNRPPRQRNPRAHR